MKLNLNAAFQCYWILGAAFDTVDHNTLLCDLENLGITGFSELWLKTYLTNRKFKLIVNGEESEKGSMKYCVPNRGFTC